ncbi:MAG: GNAT family N-acetyltransferase [Ruminococcaceae bacterium]|nr:GNAT family N-acetyltransferase [Oscillospiraceae bacterium]
MKKEKIYRVFSHLPELTTPRLTLRRMMVADTEDMYEYASRPDVTKYLTWYPHPDRHYTREYLQYLGNRYAAGMFYDWAVIYEPDCKMVGTCGFTAFNCAADSAEVGYVLNPSYWGKGIATEALTRVLYYAFHDLKLHRVEAKYIEGNERSRRVMEKVGMTFEGIMREGMLIKGSYVNVGICSILRSEWEALQKTRANTEKSE